MTVIQLVKDLVSGGNGKLQKPVVLQFPVIDICNSRCQMCHIWQRKGRDEITVEQIRSGLSDELFSEVRSVGLNGGEPTLRDDLGEIAAALFATLPRLRNVSLITNAFKTEQVIARIDDVAKVVSEAGGFLDVMVSLDGIDGIHDAVRGKPGNFERAKIVIEYVKNNALVSNVRIGCTILKENAMHLHELHDFCVKNGIYIKYRIGIPHKRLYTDNLSDPYNLNNNEKINIISFLSGVCDNYEKRSSQRFFYKSLIEQLRFGAPRAAGCDWRHRGATLTSRGELLYCAVQSPVLATLDQGDLGKRYFAAKPILDDIKATKCASCRHDYVGLPDRKRQLKLAGEEAVQRFGLEGPLVAAYEKSGLKALRARQRLRTFSKAVAQIAATPRSGEVEAAYLICGWYGTETLGDKAILGSVLTALRSCDPVTPIKLASLQSDFSQLTASQMPELNGVEIISTERAVAKAASYRALIFGGGPLMAINEIMMMRRLFHIVREHGGATVVAGCGVGPVGSKKYQAAIADLLMSSDLRIYRDEASRRRAADMGIDVRHDAVTEDPAFDWILRNRVNRARAPDTLLLGLRRFPWKEYAPELGRKKSQELSEKADSAIAQALAKLAAERPGLRIAPVPMCTNPYGDDDRWYYRSLFGRDSSLGDRVDWSLIGAELSPLDYLRAFENAGAALTMRFHSLVFALACGLPALSLDYTLGQGKVTALANQAGVENLRFGSFDSDMLYVRLSDLLDRPPSPVSLPQPRFPEVFRSGFMATLQLEEV